MARRKRLDTTLPPAEPASQRTPVSRPPIAEVAGQTASAGERALAMAEEAGHLIRALPLDAIEVNHLHRDRTATTKEDFAALLMSIEAHGQRTAIEVLERQGAAPDEPPYGLISGWRRLTALQDLAQKHPDDPRYATVKAIVRAPADLAEAYLAMVEENEIRADISYFERAQAVRGAVAAGAFADERTALNTLFAAGSKTRRSKIRSFLEIVDHCRALLSFPEAMGERQGLRLAEAIRAGQGGQIARAIGPDRFETPAEEVAALARILDNLSRPTGPDRSNRDRLPPVKPAGRRALTPEVSMRLTATAKGTKIELEGVDLTARQDALMRALRAVLAEEEAG